MHTYYVMHNNLKTMAVAIDYLSYETSVILGIFAG